MPSIKRSDLVTGILLCALAVYAYQQGAAMPSAGRGLGPGGYPKFIAAGLFALGLILSVQALVKAVPSSAQPFSGRKILRVLAFVPMCLAYGFALRPLGFILSSTCFLLLAASFFGYRKRGVLVAFSILLPLALYGVFRNIFLVLLPTLSWW